MTLLSFKKISSFPLYIVALTSIACCHAAPSSEQNQLAEVERASLKNSSINRFSENIVPLSVKGENFTDPMGNIIRFWGVNLVAFYPSHPIAEKTAENLANLGINLVRPHHLMRPGRDWNPQMKSGALVDYANSSRQFDQAALDKFDYLNAALRKKGIYLAFSLGWSRSYHEGDVDILKTTPEDAAAWANAWKEIKAWHWLKQRDVVKSLSLIDERFMAIDQEFATQILNHVNPYTTLTYAQDPQVATIEIINEYGAEYTFICNNKFPAYFHEKLQRKWNEYALNNGIETSDFYQPKTIEQRMLRLDFLVSLDAARMKRMTTIARELGYKGAITYSNLFRGENLLAEQEKNADYMEDHIYADPYVVNSKDDLFYATSKSFLKDKPFILSEFNVTENQELREKQKNKRTMLIAATVAYASLQNWSGITWFAWQHGTNQIGKEGWAKNPDRNLSLGNLAKDEMQIDHFKTAATIFRNGYITPASTKIMYIDAPYKYDGYHQFMAGKYQFQQGWQNIYPIRKTFSTTTSDTLKNQQTTEWMSESPSSPLVSATKQIIKDTERKQLTVTAKKAEIFSGYLDDQAPAGLKFLQLSKNQGFATIMVASNDGADLIKAEHILISKTFFEENFSFFSIKKTETESDEIPITLNTDNAYSKWQLKITRPIHKQETFELIADYTGKLTLPTSHWHQLELSKIDKLR
jgi:hypothetical protein